MTLQSGGTDCEDAVVIWLACRSTCLPLNCDPAKDSLSRVGIALDSASSSDAAASSSATTSATILRDGMVPVDGCCRRYKSATCPAAAAVCTAPRVHGIHCVRLKSDTLIY